MISFYIHIPFCVRKCYYCDFLSFPASDEVRDGYIRALCDEIVSYAGIVDEPVRTLFFGGGTPSILTPGQLMRITDTIRANYMLTSDAEISLECNPKTADRDTLQAYMDIGINRLSIGLQSASDPELKILGRIHDLKDFENTYYWARDAGFDNINIDIMSAIPGQTLESYKDTLTKIVNYGPEHISAYSLIIEEGTKFHDLYGDDRGVIYTHEGNGSQPGNDTRCGMPELPDEDTERDMYHMTKDMLTGFGYHRYEISNYSKDGYECRHNNVYWTGGEYIGFGLGASSYHRHYRYRNTPDMKEYLEGKGKRYDLTYIDERSAMEEFMYLGLRRMEGVSAGLWRERFNKDIWDTYGRELKKLIDDDLIIMEDGDRIRLTERGIDVSNIVFSNFLLD